MVVVVFRLLLGCIFLTLLTRSDPVRKAILQLCSKETCKASSCNLSLLNMVMEEVEGEEIWEDQDRWDQGMFRWVQGLEETTHQVQGDGESESLL